MSKVDDELITKLLKALGLLELKDRYKINSDNFETTFDLLCYVYSLSLLVTDKDLVLPTTGLYDKHMAMSTMQTAITIVELLQRRFHIDIPAFSVENNIEFEPITIREVYNRIEKEKPDIKMFDTVIFDDPRTLQLVGIDPIISEIPKFRKGNVLYVANMKNKKRGFNKFENDVKDILMNSFLYETIFMNPVRTESGKEFSDILIDFFGSVLIFQCKTCNTEDDEKLTRKTVIAGLNQLSTSVTRANNKNVKLFMMNSIKTVTDYDFSNLKEIYPILIVNKKVSFASFNFFKENYKDLKQINFIPVILTIDDLKFLISELDTPSDIFEYLKKREEIIRDDKLIFENEIELLSYYLMNLKSFEPKIVGTRLPIITGIYKEYINGRYSSIFKERKKLDKPSYWIDKQLKNAHITDKTDYLKGIEELAKLTRMQRRMLVWKIEDKRSVAIKEHRDSWGMMIYKEKPDIAFLVYFTTKSVEERNKFLIMLCGTGKYKTNVYKIIGIGQNPIPEKRDIELISMCCIDGPNDYSESQKKVMDKDIADLGLWGETTAPTFSEYPEDFKP